jgi:hypothetical protein
MADYRLYFLDGANHIRRAVEFHCDDDAAATARAHAEADGRCMELWSRSRFVRRFDRHPEAQTESA